MYGIWAAASEVEAPTWVNWPPSSVAAFLAPADAASKYGLLIAFGMNTTFRLALAPLPAADPAADAGADAAADAAEAAALGALDEPLLEQAAASNATAVMRAAIRPVR